MAMMRTFSAKLWLFLTAVTCVVALGAAWSVYVVASQSQMERLRTKLVTLATTVSQFIDGDAFATLQRADQQDSAEWKQIAETLLKFQDTDPEIKYVYTLARTPDTDRSGQLQFIVDPSPDMDDNQNGRIDPGEEGAVLGARYDARTLAPRMLDALDHPTCDDQIEVDQWGPCLSGYAPLRSQKGDVVGIVGVDVTAGQIAEFRRDFVRQCWIVVFAVILTTLLISTLVSWYINKPVKALYEGIQKVQAGNLNAEVRVDTQDEFQRLADAFNTMMTGLREREFIRTTLDRYMSKQVADEVIRRGEAFFHTAERRRLTVLFCDVRGMTTISEKVAPEETVRILSRYLDHMIEAVFRHGGTVDKILGDGLMAVFGAPLEMPNHEEAAINCGLDMIRALVDIRRQTGIEKFGIGVGINTGSVVVGNIGSGKILDYTVIGDAVNVASRLESETRNQDANILISQATAEPVKGHFDMRLIGPLTIRGRAEPVIVYAVDSRRLT